MVICAKIKGQRLYFEVVDAKSLPKGEVYALCRAIARGESGWSEIILNI